MLVKTAGYEVAGNMPGESVDMSLSGESLEHIMDILSDLYSNRPAAIVREYGTNAIDAHIISGQTKPIEITTPNRLNPNLVIRDFGNGMSKQVLIDTYSKYGASTKRTNNLEAGQLGLGSKSGFAYTDQFTVRSVHEGHCCELIMSRNDRGAAEMTIAFDYATDDPSGVTITVPIKTEDIYSVNIEAESFADYAKPGTVAVNEKINTMPDHWNKIADNMYSSAEISTHMIVMGNVAYPADLFDNVWLPYNSHKLIAFVGMGEVDFVPSRESLKYTKFTKNTIANIEQYMLDSISEQAADLIDNADTVLSKVHAYKLFRKWERFFPQGMPDLDFRSDIEQAVKDTKHFVSLMPKNIDNRQDRIHNDYHRVLNFERVANMIDKEFMVLTDFPSEKISREQARKILTIKPDLAGKQILVFENNPENLRDIFTDWTFVSWDKFKKVRASKPRSTSVKTKTQQGNLYLGDIVHHRRRQQNPRMMKTTGPAYYCSLTEFDSMSSLFFPREDFKLFFVIPSKQEVFKRKNPHAKSLTEYIANHNQQLRKHVVSSKIIAKSMPYAYDTDRLTRCIDLSEITNEDFMDKVRLASRGYKWSRMLGYHSGGGFTKYLEHNYPLVKLYSYASMTEREHMVRYINMIGESNVSA